MATSNVCSLTVTAVWSVLLFETNQIAVLACAGCFAGLDPHQQTILLTTVGLPWNYKIFYGLLSDGVPIAGSHRRSYIFLAGLFGVIGFVGMGLIADDGANPDLVMYLLALTTLSTAFCDVCTDALVAANAKLESEAGAGNLQSLCWVRC